jgi:hypothetical protein
MGIAGCQSRACACPPSPLGCLACDFLTHGRPPAHLRAPAVASVGLSFARRALGDGRSRFLTHPLALSHPRALYHPPWRAARSTRHQGERHHAPTAPLRPASPPCTPPSRNAPSPHPPTATTHRSRPPATADHRCPRLSRPPPEFPVSSVLGCWTLTGARSPRRSTEESSQRGRTNAPLLKFSARVINSRRRTDTSRSAAPGPPDDARVT